jgi:hypothetical protein
LDAKRETGKLCNQTVPGPLKTAKNNPSPPKIAFFTPLTI